MNYLVVLALTTVTGCMYLGDDSEPGVGCSPVECAAATPPIEGCGPSDCSGGTNECGGNIYWCFEGCVVQEGTCAALEPDASLPDATPDARVFADAEPVPPDAAIVPDAAVAP